MKIHPNHQFSRPFRLVRQPFEADLKTKSLEGESPLHMTVRCDHDQALQLLLAARGDVEERNVEGQAPLHCAATYGSTRAATVASRRGVGAF